MKGYRTIGVAILVILAGAAQSAKDVVPVEYLPALLQVSGVLMLVLRLITTSPPLQAPEPPPGVDLHGEPLGPPAPPLG